MAGERKFLYLDVAFKVGLWSGATAPAGYLASALNLTKLEITVPPQEVQRITSRMEGSIGQALATVQRPTGEPASLAAEFDAAPRDLIALALGADVADLTIAAAVVTDEAVTTVLELWVPLANQWIDPATFVLETPGAPDVVIDPSKYELDAVNGLLMALHADAVGAKEATYDVLETTGATYAAGQAKSAYVQLVGTCTEQASKTRGRIVIARAALAADGAFDLSAGGALKGSLKGDLETPAGLTSPWTYQATEHASPY